MQGPKKAGQHVGDHSYHKGAGALGQFAKESGKMLTKINNAQIALQNATKGGAPGLETFRFGSRKMTPLAKVLQSLDKQGIAANVPGRTGTPLANTKVTEQTGKHAPIKHPGTPQTPTM